MDRETVNDGSLRFDTPLVERVLPPGRAQAKGAVA